MGTPTGFFQGSVKGAWGVGNFENDEAADWVYELERSHCLAILLVALEPVTGAEDYLDAVDCTIALGASEVIAAVNGRPSSDLPLEVADLVGRQQISELVEAVILARQAVTNIAAESELQELFEESDEFESWLAILSDLGNRLTGSE